MQGILRTIAAEQCSLINAQAERSLREVRQQLSECSERLAQMQAESQRVVQQKDQLLEDMRGVLETSKAPEVKPLTARLTQLDHAWRALVEGMGMSPPTTVIPLTQKETEVSAAFDPPTIATSPALWPGLLLQSGVLYSEGSGYAKSALHSRPSLYLIFSTVRSQTTGVAHTPTAPSE